MRLRVYVPEGISDWESGVALFRVGRADSCALRFQGELAKYAGWEHAEFTTDDQGRSYITDLESKNGTYLDGVRIAAPAVLQVGAIVQIGTKGPKLEVLELKPPAGHRPAPVTPPALVLKRWGLIAVAVALLLVVGFLLVRRGGSVVPDPKQENLPVADANNKDGEKTPNDAEAPPNQRTQPDEKPTPPPEPRPQPPQIPPALVPAFAAYRLIAVEDPESQTTRPFAGAVVVTPHALITSADVGVELARVRQRGWPVKVLRNAQDPGLPVDSVRIQAPFQETEPAKQFFFDVAILSVKERLEDVATPASNAELDAAKEACQLVCLAANHSGEPLDGFEELRAVAYEAKVRRVDSLSPEAGAPRVLSLRGQLGENVSGSPIFNDKGHLVALYCDPAALADGTPDRANHYAIVVQMGLVKLGVAQAESELWVTPVPSTEPTKKDSAK